MTCSSSTHTCVCPQKSSGNLVVNPGFDSTASLNGWINDSGTVTWISSSDANGCSGSGSALSTGGELDQCIPVSNADGLTFYMGYSYRQDTGSTAICTLWFNGDTTCGSRLGDARRDLLMVTGQTSPTGPTGFLSASGSIAAYPGTVAVWLRCFSQGGTAQAWFDNVYVRTTPGGF
jgi:hypothetical protein